MCVWRTARRRVFPYPLGNHHRGRCTTSQANPATSLERVLLGRMLDIGFQWGKRVILVGSPDMDKAQIANLIYQALETEIGGSKVYKTALRCVQNRELKEEWKEYL